jgi:hypothetical protein
MKTLSTVGQQVLIKVIFEDKIDIPQARKYTSSDVWKVKVFM